MPCCWGNTLKITSFSIGTPLALQSGSPSFCPSFNYKQFDLKEKLYFIIAKFSDFTFYSDRYCFILNYHNGKFLVSLLCSFNCGVSDPPECSNTSTDVETNADDDVLEPILAYKHLSRLKLFITIGEVVIKQWVKLFSFKSDSRITKICSSVCHMYSIMPNCHLAYWTLIWPALWLLSLFSSIIFVSIVVWQMDSAWKQLDVSTPACWTTITMKKR